MNHRLIAAALVGFVSLGANAFAADPPAKPAEARPAATKPAVTKNEADKPAEAKAEPEPKTASRYSTGPVEAQDVTGEWSGEWGPYNPAKSAALDKEKCKGIDCKVIREGNVWKATFEGECGRPYKYTIKMEGRQAGSVVLFKGTTDLGEQDGGVFDWVGRATEKEFVGFYTSAHYSGVFQLQRAMKK